LRIPTDSAGGAWGWCSTTPKLFTASLRYSLDLLYTLGLGDAFVEDVEPEDAEKHRGATLVAGISFPLGR